MDWSWLSSVEALGLSFHVWHQALVADPLCPVGCVVETLEIQHIAQTLVWIGIFEFWLAMGANVNHIWSRFEMWFKPDFYRCTLDVLVVWDFKLSFVLLPMQRANEVKSRSHRSASDQLQAD